MTVSSTTNRKTFAGNGVTTSFGTSPVVFFDSDELSVYVTDDDTGDAETLVENTDYTVTGGDGSTGTLNLAAGSGPYGAPAAGATLVIVRTLPLTQEFDPDNGDASDAEAVEQAFDKQTMVSQQLTSTLGRTLRLPESDPSSSFAEIPPLAERAGMFMYFDDDGDPTTANGTAEPNLTVPSSVILGGYSANANSDYNFHVKRLITDPTSVKSYDLISASEITAEGTAGSGTPSIRGGYFDIASNVEGALCETSAISGFVRIEDTSLTAPNKIWGGEVHVTKASGVANSQMIGFEVGMHKVPAAGALPAVGLLVSSYDFGAHVASRADEAVRIQGGAGWTYGIRYFDTNGSTELFGVTQTGLVRTSGGVQVTSGNLALGTPPIANVGVFVSGAVTATATNQFGADMNPTVSSATTANGIGIRGKVTSATASFTMTNAIGLYSAAHVKGSGSTISNAIGLYLETQTVGGTNLLISSAAGATLTTSGVWTDAPSFAALKDVKTSPAGQSDRWLAWLRDEYKGVRYRYHGKTGGPVDQKGDYDHFGFLLDDVPQDLREVFCANKDGGISGKDVDGFLLAVVQRLAKQVQELEDRRFVNRAKRLLRKLKVMK